MIDCAKEWGFICLEFSIIKILADSKVSILCDPSNENCNTGAQVSVLILVLVIRLYHLWSRSESVTKVAKSPIQHPLMAMV